jgi:hypothetical protein
MQVRRSRRIARGVPLDDVHLRPGRPQLETLPSRITRGSSQTPKTRSLPWSIVATSVHLSFFARVSGFIGSLSCKEIICSPFLIWLVTRRDCERLATLDHHSLAIDDHRAGHGSAQPSGSHLHLNGTLLRATGATLRARRIGSMPAERIVERNVTSPTLRNKPTLDDNWSTSHLAR